MLEEVKKKNKKSMIMIRVRVNLSVLINALKIREICVNESFVGKSSPCCESMRNCVQIPRTHVIIWHAMHAFNPSAVGGKDRRISGVSWNEHSSRYLSSEWSGIGYPIFFSGLHNVTGSEKKIAKNQQKETWLRKEKNVPKTKKMTI